MSVKSKYPICLYPVCEKEGYARGLCRNHYRQLGNFVRAGKTTWSKLEEDEKVLPRKKLGRGPGEFQNWAVGKPAGTA